MSVTVYCECGPYNAETGDCLCDASRTKVTKADVFGPAPYNFCFGCGRNVGQYHGDRCEQNLA